MRPPVNVVTAVRSRVRSEFDHAPLGTSGAVVAMGDVTVRVFEASLGKAHEASTQPSSLAQAAHHPIFVPIVEAIVFQIVIAFALSKLLLMICKQAVYVSVGATLLLSCTCCYATCLNVARLLSSTSGSVSENYFNTVLLAALGFTGIQVAAYGKEQPISPARWIFYTACSVVFMFAFASIFGPDVTS